MRWRLYKKCEKRRCYVTPDNSGYMIAAYVAVAVVVLAYAAWLAWRVRKLR